MKVQFNSREGLQSADAGSNTGRIQVCSKLTLSKHNKAIILEWLRSLYEGFRPFFILRHPTKTEVGFKDGSIIVIIDNHYQL